MACKSWSEKLDLYLDGELGASEAGDLNTHLRSCTDCAAGVLERVQLKRATAIAGKHYEASPELRRKITKLVAKQSPPRTALAWKLLFVPAALIVILSLGVQLFVQRENARRARVFGELADLHVATLASSTPVDVISSDRHTVKPWFQGKIPFTFSLPELQGTEFTLIGGRIAYFGQNPGAQLIYQWRKHMISVFIFQNAPEDFPGSGAAHANSFNFEALTKDGLHYFLIGDAGAEQIGELAVLLRNAH